MVFLASSVARVALDIAVSFLGFSKLSYTLLRGSILSLKGVHRGSTRFLLGVRLGFARVLFGGSARGPLRVL